ncbi:M28 family peptidase [Pararhodonellum marinum]|uniref:M28 family peptidase n=1 Tax=Pararhodonellum marinum TaxID=2755358 RepID=UPI00188E60AB|nr:M28 family peptidase [Pararhodonellum marinum]
MRNPLKLFFLILFFGPQVLFSQEINKEQLLTDLQYLASNELQGRKTLTPGNVLAQQFIKDRFDSLGLSSQFPDFTQHFNFYNRKEKITYEKAVNLVGFVAGSEKEDIILILAHYDHLGKINEQVFLGADDNASGVAALLQLAGYFSFERPLHSMIFAALDAEEMGLHGAKALLEDFPFDKSQIKLVVNLDMVSRSKDQELFAVGTHHYPELKRPLENVAKNASINLTLGKDIPGTGKEDWSQASDHGPFHAAGIPFIYFGVEDHEDYHQPTDTFENIDQDFYFEAVKTILEALREFDAQ